MSTFGDQIRAVRATWDDQEGPCYDLCSCHHCWNGWKAIPFRRRLRWRLRYLLHWPWWEREWVHDDVSMEGA